MNASDASLPIAIAGASGRMGRMLIEAVLQSGDCRLAGALDVAASPALGQDAAAFLGRSSAVAITSDVRQGLSGARVLIDFTRPEGTLAHLAVCRELGVAAVVGTTGLSPTQKAEVAAHAGHIPVVMAPNMSVGVNVVFKLLDVAARALAQGYDIEIIEAAIDVDVSARKQGIKKRRAIAVNMGEQRFDMSVLGLPQGGEIDRMIKIARICAPGMWTVIDDRGESRRRQVDAMGFLHHAGAAAPLATSRDPGR